MPCCDDGNVVNCADGSCEQTVTIEKFVPEISVTVSCDNNGTSLKATTKDCITGCGGCGCEDAGLCRCIPLGATITLTPTAIKNDGSCTDEDFTVITTIGEDELNSQTVTYGDDVDLDPILIQFETEGSYEIVITATNCCTSCEGKWTIYVGSPVQVNRLMCGMFQIADFSIGVRPRKRIVLTRIDNKEIARWIIESEDEFPKMNIPDGIHILSYDEIDDIGTVLNSKKFVLYEFCNLFNCYQNILKNYLCDNCNCDNLTDAAAFRDLANRFVTASFAFFTSIEIQYGNTAGSLTYKESELGLLRNQDILYDGIMRLCGACLDSITDGSINCTTC